MFKFSSGEKIRVIAIGVLFFINPIYAIMYHYLFEWYKLKDYKTRDIYLIFGLVLCAVPTIYAIGYVYFEVLRLIFNGIDNSIVDYLTIGIRFNVIVGLIPGLLFFPQFNWIMIRRYYNAEENMERRLEKSDHKVKENKKSIYDEDVQEANKNLELKEKAFRMGVDKNLEPVYYNEDSQNCMMFATTGTGKTILVMNMIKDSLLNGNHLLYINGKGNMEDTEKVIEMCDMYGKEYVVINIGEENEVKYNPFKNANATTIRDMLLSLSDWSEEHYKTAASAYYQVVLNLIDIKKFDIYKFLSVIEDEQALKQVQESKEEMNKWLRKANVSILNNSKVVSSSTSRIMQLFGGDGEKIFSSDGIDILDAIKEDKAIIVNLNPNNYAETSKVLFRLITLDIRKSFDYLDGNTRIISAFFDEFGVYADDEFINVLNQSRSSGYKIYPTAQTPADIKYTLGEDFLDRVIDNCNSFLFGRVNSPQSAGYMADVIGTVEKMQITRVTNELVEGDMGTAKKVHQYIYHPSDIKRLGKGEFLYCCKDTNQIDYLYSKYYKD